MTSASSETLALSRTNLGSGFGVRARVLRLLSELHHCRISIEENGETIEFGDTEASEITLPPVRIRVHDAKFYWRTALGGSVGAAESYMDGQWDCDDLVSLVRILVRNRDRLDAMERGPARILGLLMRLGAMVRRNTIAGSRKNIAAHYDLGNDLFELFLDQNLMYSSAIFASEEESLENASERKLDVICRKLDLSPRTSVLEIGSGWGGFALHAARKYGCHVTTATISQEQFDLASARVREAGLEDRITVVLSDYRDLAGTYDRVVSIEMIEAIGHQYLERYFGVISSRLKETGLALIQAITIEDYRYKQALKSVDFIKRHIFPGSFIPSITAMLGAMSVSSNLRLINLEDFGQSYALTLRTWRNRFLARQADVRALGYSAEFVRTWEFYLAYCEGGFMERATGVSQFTLAKPLARPSAFSGQPL